MRAASGSGFEEGNGRQQRSCEDGALCGGGSRQGERSTNEATPSSTGAARQGGNAEVARDLSKEKLIKLMRAVMVARQLRIDSQPCKIESGLYLGSIGAAYNKEALKLAGITHIVSLGSVLDTPYPDLFQYHRVEVPDSPDADLASMWDACFEFIDEAKRSGGSVLVHCFAGRSRSVTIVVAYLMKTHNMLMCDALDRVRRCRACACPNPGFMKQLKALDRRLSHAQRQGKSMKAKSSSISFPQVIWAALKSPRRSWSFNRRLL